MRKIVFVLLIIFSACLIKAHEFTMTWDFNPEPDMDRYTVYVYETVDSVRAVHNESNFWRSFSHDSLQLVNSDTAIVKYEGALNNKYLQFFAFAVDSSGNRSVEPGYSNILRKKDTTPPGTVMTASVVK